MSPLAEKIKRLANGPDSAYRILCCIDELCHKSGFPEINAMLETINLDDLDTTTICIILGATNFPSGRQKFPARTSFVERVKLRLADRADREELLRGLI